ncbi:MAG: PIN domain-containing protein [Acidimicrobiia bacterium]|nr:PIN domain-containing protein [Acidimicrobiia bacterium]
MRFLDTNILLYAISTDPAEKRKVGIALRVLEAGDLATSVQVLQEFYAQSTRASKPDRIPHETAVSLVESFLRFPTHEVTVQTMRSALATSTRFRISYWDAAIIESARALDCPVVLTEDLNHGQDFQGVRIVNPFRR